MAAAGAAAAPDTAAALLAAFVAAGGDCPGPAMAETALAALAAPPELKRLLAASREWHLLPAAEHYGNFGLGRGSHSHASLCIVCDSPEVSVPVAAWRWRLCLRPGVFGVNLFEAPSTRTVGPWLDKVATIISFGRVVIVIRHFSVCA
jgi:hypothetical protein